MFKAGDTTHKIGVYGNLRKQKEVREKAPSELLTLFDYYTGYNNSNATDWEPTHIEVMIWPYDYAPEKSIIWPSDWPDINSSSTRKRGDSYSIYLPFEHYDKLKRFIATRNEKGAVEINGEKWAISTRSPFPHEIAMN